jgi:hypothetical protein
MKHLLIIEVEENLKIPKGQSEESPRTAEFEIPTLESERSCMCVLEVSILPLSTALIFDFGMDSTAWCVLFLFYNKN